MTLQDIIYEVNKETSFEIEKRTRKRPVVYARVVYVMLAIELLPKQSLSAIGRAVGVTHASIIHARDKLSVDVFRYEPFYRDIHEKIRLRLICEESVDNNIYDTELLKKIEEYNELERKYNEIISFNDDFSLIMDSIRTVPADKMDLFKLRLNAMITMIKA